MWIHKVIVEANRIGYSGRPYIVRVTKMSRLITYNTRHICKTSITVMQCLQEQIMKGTGHLEDIFTDTK